jgi:BirA family biotin operon repressor/biotin-[acetyl-CoA-carboxylase] ligase
MLALPLNRQRPTANPKISTFAIRADRDYTASLHMAKHKPQPTLPGVTDRRIAALLTLLAENATIVVSGARIAREIGVSRSTVWRWVTRLRELGVRVKGEQHTGYFLEKVPDILTPDMLRQRLKGSLFGKRVHHFFKVDSTNRVALDLGHAGEPEGAVVLAEEQTAGRGRAGHPWHSERATGIYATLLLRPHLAPVQAPLLTMMAGLSAHAAIRAQTGLHLDLKWPNDLVFRGKKVGGILTEMHAEPTQIRFVIVGIGLNVNQERFPAELSDIATSLRVETGKPQSRLELLVRLLREFEADYNRFLTEGGASVISRFCGLSSYAQGLRVRVTNGNDSFSGVTTGLSPEGSLLVRRDCGPIVTVIAGDVTEDRSILVVDSRSMDRIKDTTKSREESV